MTIIFNIWLNQVLHSRYRAASGLIDIFIGTEHSVRIVCLLVFSEQESEDVKINSVEELEGQNYKNLTLVC